MGYLLTDRFLNEKIMFYADRKLEKKLKDTKVIKIFKLLNYANITIMKLELSENLTIAPLQRFSCSKKVKFQRYQAGKS